MVLKIAILIAVIFAGAISCPADARDAMPASIPDTPQSLPLTDLYLAIAPAKPHRIKVQTVLTPQQQETGLMWRKSMPADEGMLFVFPEAKQATFWMRNTLIPLDLVFIRSDGTIANVAAKATPLSLETIPSKGRVIAVLELVGGRAKTLGVKSGQRVCHATLPACQK
jgi:uncharacterized protein